MKPVKRSLRTEWPHLLILAAMLTAAVLVWPQAAEQIPVHWNIRGEVDGWGDKTLALFSFPAIALVIYLLMLFLPKFDPRRENFSTFAPTYDRARMMILLFVAVVFFCLLPGAFGRQLDVAKIIVTSVGILLALLGNLFTRIPPNWFLGVRTPWTLTSDRAWVKTHRLASWMFITVGAATTLFAFASVRTQTAVLLTGTVAAVFVSLVYSYVVWKDDPNRLATADSHGKRRR